MQDEYEHFRSQVDDLAIDRCHVYLSYLGRRSDAPGGPIIWFAEALVSPVPSRTPPDEFSLQSQSLVAGRVLLSNQSRDSVLSLAEQMSRGVLEVSGMRLEVPGLCNHEPPVDLKTSHPPHDSSQNVLSLKVESSDVIAPLKPFQRAAIDAELRLLPTPFDGLRDLLAAVGAPEPSDKTFKAVMTMKVWPPVELKLDACRLHAGRLDVTLVAAESYRTEDVRLSVLGYPGQVAKDRRQLAGEVVWGGQRDSGVTSGHLSADFGSASRVLLILSVRSTIVQRWWVVDLTKTNNLRLLAVREFDHELDQLKRKLFPMPGKERPGSRHFEMAVAELAFLLGFAAVQQLETDGPDIILATPGGALAIVECTVEFKDIPTKTSKLVDRRERLARALGRETSVLAVLVTAQARAQIARAEDLRANRVFLIAQDDLRSAIERLQFPTNAEALFSWAVQQVESSP